MSTNTPLEPSKLFFKHAITANDTQFLVGRRALIEDIANKLAEDRVSAVIYGPRGVGKTTVAWQVISLLEGTSPLFKKTDSLTFGRSERFRCAFHKCARDVSSIGELLVDLVLSTQGANRFSSVFKRLFGDVDTVRRIERKFGINILKILQYEEKENVDVSDVGSLARTTLGDEKARRQFAHDIFERMRHLYPDERLIIFVDEIDRSRAGISDLGDFIKDVDDVQFVFVGISKNIESLIGDHRSAGRKLAGNDFFAPFLSSGEIRQIMLTAEQLSKDRLRVTTSYQEKLIEYSGGIPWITQHVGYESTFRAVRKNSRSEEFVLDIDVFDDAMRRVIDVYENDAEARAAVSAVRNMGHTEHSLLNLIWESLTGMPEDSLRDKIESNLKRYFDGALESLVEKRVIEKVDGKFVFFDAASRIFVKYELDRTSS